VKAKIKPETILRTIVLIIALINQALAIFGREALPITEDEVYEVYRVITYIITLVVSMWAWWKNNSFTLPAIKADEYLEQLRKEEQQ
jgi:SPP1 family holin